MAFSCQYYYLSCSFFILLNFLTLTNQQLICPFDTLYQIGDSTSDTGNLVRLPIYGPTLPAARPPYGETFPGNPTGRWSDGRLIIDYIATKVGLPLLHPYSDRNASFANGVNFAVAGATALNISFPASRGVIIPPIFTLGGQVEQFRQYLNSICSTPTECSERLKKALIVLGDIGNNDINFALSQNRSVQKIMEYVVPFIPEAIANATREIIGLGANKIIVPGEFPQGCLPTNLVLFPNEPKDNYGCLISINKLTQYYNKLLKKTLIGLSLEFPHANIIYVDYYSAFQFIILNAPAFGFEPTTLLKACCGIGGVYNYDRNRSCGSAGVPVCPNPVRYIQWDGVHYTQEAHRRMTEFLLPNILAKLNCHL